MAGSARFESSSGSPEDLDFAGSYPNGQRGSYPVASLDRSGGFRESSESRMFSSGASMPRGSAALMGDLPPITQYLPLDLVTIETQKYTRLGELRRALGIISFGSTAEDNSFGAAYSKPAPAVATEELKWFKATVLDASDKAKIRSFISVERSRIELVASGMMRRENFFEELFFKINKYIEALNLKKQQRSEMITNERSGGLSFLKMGTQSSRNPAELVNQKVEDRAKNGILSRRVRSSVAEIRAEGPTNSLAKRAMVMGKNRDMLRDCGEGSDTIDEKIGTLSAGGETWDKKMKRKRSTVPLGRPSDEGEAKRAMHHKLNNDLSSTSCDAQTFRSGTSNGTTKLDGASLPASSNGHAIAKNEPEKVPLSRDSMPGLSKERLKGSNKRINVREDNQMLSPNQLIKGKASRAPRSGPLISGNLSPNFPRSSGAPEGWEQPSVSKICSATAAINRNRPMPTGSSSPSVAQWGGQRPQKISRTRRTTILSPVSNLDEEQISPEGCSPDLGTRFTTSGSNGSLARSMSSGTQQLRAKNENISSPARLSESEESGACENHDSRLKEKGAGSGELEDRGANSFLNTVPSTLHTKKSKITCKEETGDGVRRQGRNGKGSSFSRVSTSPVKEKLENLASAKPLKNARVGSERNSSKTGRPPLKKISERKGIGRLGHVNAIGSPHFAGEPDDDCEELLAAANFACNASYLACSSSFWKQMQSIFAPVNLEETSYLKEQLKFMEVNYESLCQMFGLHNDTLNNCIEENLVSQAHVSGGKEKTSQDQIWNLDSVGGRLDSERKKIVPPLYQRVLSALIMEDESDEFEEDCRGRFTCFPYNGKYSSDADFERRNMVRNPLTIQQCAAEVFSCNGNGNFTESKSIHTQLFNNNLLKGNQRGPYLDDGMMTGFSVNGVDGPLSVCTNASEILSSDCAYEQMSMEEKLLLELQSVGLYPEIVPDLADGDDEAINSVILGLQKGLFEQLGKTKVWVKTIVQAIEEGNEIEKRGLEQVAMDRLVELAYKKLLATRGSFASKRGVAKVPKQVAMAFMRRTLARCRKYEDAGKSCFSEPALRDIIYSTPVRGSDPELTRCIGSAPGTRNSQPEPRLSGVLSDWAERYDNRTDKIGRNSIYGIGNLTPSSYQDFAKTGPIMNRGKKKELLLDDVGGSPSLKAASSFGNNLLGGAKGKRSERDTCARNSVAKASRLPLGNYKGERKTKTKPKQKTAPLSTSGNVSVAGSGDIVGSGSNRKREVGLMSTDCNNNPDNQSTEMREQMDFPILQLNELDSIELGVVNELDGHQDLSTWLNIEEVQEDGLQDHDSVGLDIPMDDLSDLNMIL